MNAEVQVRTGKKRHRNDLFSHCLSKYQNNKLLFCLKMGIRTEQLKRGGRT